MFNTRKKLDILVTQEEKTFISFDIKKFITQVLTIKGISEGHLEFNFVSNTSLKKINSNYLNHDYETDIITFNLTDDSQILTGDIYIAPEIAEKNRKMYNNSFENEIKLLIIHGILHLLHYKDDTNTNKTIMDNEQKRILKELDTSL